MNNTAYNDNTRELVIIALSLSITSLTIIFSGITYVIVKQFDICYDYNKCEKYEKHKNNEEYKEIINHERINNRDDYISV